MKYALIFSCSAWYLAACSPIISNCYPHLKDVEEITKKFLSITSKTDHFDLSVRGTDFNTDIAIIVLGVIKQDLLTLEEARILFVSKVEQVLALANSYRSIKTPLQNDSITFKNLEFSIEFRTKDFPYPDVPYISYVYMKDEKLYYSSGEAMTLKLIESYEAALQWVKENAPWVLEQG